MGHAELKHAELRNIITTFIRNNPQLLGSGWPITDCTDSQHLGIVTKVGQYGSHVEIKAAASLDSCLACMWAHFSLERVHR